MEQYRNLNQKRTMIIRENKLDITEWKPVENVYKNHKGFQGKSHVSGEVLWLNEILIHELSFWFHGELISHNR